MSESRIDAFLDAAEAGGVVRDAQDAHALLIAAKKVRLAVETGRQLRNDEWRELFPDERVRHLAREMLTDVSITDIDFEATMHQSMPAEPEASEQTMALSPSAVQRKWHALLISIPDDGLLAPDGGSMISSLELGRLILLVSQGKGRVSYSLLPTADGFRDRFVQAARDAHRLQLVDGLPEGLG